MTSNTARGSRGYGESSGLIWMLLGAVLFGYFGFAPGFIWPNTVNGDLNWISIVLMWTMRATAIGFASSAVLTFIHRLIANVLYCVVGLLCAVMFCIVVIWHSATDAHAPISPFLLAIFAAFIGYGSWTELNQMLAIARDSRASGVQ